MLQLVVEPGVTSGQQVMQRLAALNMEGNKQATDF